MINIPCMDKDKLARNFSRHANLYDRYAGIQLLAAKELIGELPERDMGAILEIGCGTGNYTLLLRKRFKTADITAVDISGRMIEVARHKTGTPGIEFIVADAEQLDLDKKFDLVTSNACFQWFGNPGKTIERYTRALTENGAILFSMFGPETFWELDRSLKDAVGEDVAISSGKFPDKDRLQSLLNRYFRENAVRELIIKETHPSLMELLNKIKYTGARGSGIGASLLWKKGVLKRMEDAYRANFGEIAVTYQIFLYKGLR